MKALRNIALAVDWLLAIAVAAAALRLAFAGDLPVYYQPRPLVLVAFGAILAILNAVALANVLYETFGTTYINLVGTGGRVKVSVRALQDSLTRAASALPEVIAAQVKVMPGKRPDRPAVLRARVTLKDDVIFYVVSRDIVNVLENRFQDIVSPGAPVECRVYWEKIKYKRGTVAVIRREPTDAAMRPQFPVDASDGDGSEV